jgi:hypothetical protein
MPYVRHDEHRGWALGMGKGGVRMDEKTTHITGWRDKGEYVVVDFIGRATIKTSYKEIVDLKERLEKLRCESS